MTIVRGQFSALVTLQDDIEILLAVKTLDNGN